MRRPGYLGSFSGNHSDSDVNALISQINSLAATMPPGSASNVLNSPTTFQSPFNTVQGLMTSYAKGLCGQNCGYNDQDYTVLSQALSNLQQISAQMQTQAQPVAQPAAQPMMMASPMNIPTAATISSSMGVPLGPMMPVAAPVDTSGSSSTLYIVGGLGLLLLIALPLLLKRRHPAPITPAKRKNRRRHR